MSEQERWRFVKRGVLEVMGLGIAYTIRVTVTDIFIPCPFYALTGLKCPGCGISHCLLALMRFDVETAFVENGLVVILLPFALVYGLYRAYQYIKKGKTDFAVWEAVVLSLVLVAAIGFGVMRNL